MIASTNHWSRFTPPPSSNTLMAATENTKAEGVMLPGQVFKTTTRFVPRISPKDFGTWRLLTSRGGTLQLKRNPDREIYLDQCNSSAQVLDWIFHYQGRLSDQELADMIGAIQVILDPCKNYCSFGSDKPANGTGLMKQYLAGYR